MQNICTNSWCKQQFEITDDDLKFYEKMAPTFNGASFPLPAPAECPDCRHQQRMAFRNERYLQKRNCDKCKKEIISIYDANSLFPVFCYDCWWSDHWDALSFGQIYDPDRQFFDQFRDLYNRVPRLGCVTGHNENCDYCNYTNYSKNSYLCCGCHNVEYSQHCGRTHWSEYCTDCQQLDRSKFCYEIIDSDNCYNLLFSQDCDGCSDSAFLYDCKGCKNCLFCVGLRNQDYCIFNKKIDKKEYEKKRNEYDFACGSVIKKATTEFQEFKLQQPHRPIFILNAENVHGDHIADSKHLYECYHVKEAEDCTYLESCEKITDSQDNTFSGWPAERVYLTMSAGVNCYNHICTTASWSCNDIFYCDSCHHSSKLLGCIGLVKKNKYCIFNTQYSEEEYEKLAAEIINHMNNDGEYGKFFPTSLTSHAYNETAAQQFYPLTEQQAQQQKFRWRQIEDHVGEIEKIIPAAKLPDNIDAIPDDILNWAIECEATKRPFRIVKQELEFYRKIQLPIPHFHPDERHKRRMALRNPRKLWKRDCMKCGEEMETTYNPERKEKVYCEECYLKEVY